MEELEFNLTDSTRVYRNSWIRFRKWRLVYWLLILTLVPAGFGLGRALGELLQSKESGVFIMFVIWGASWLVTANIMYFWRCPRCQKRFFVRGWPLVGVPMSWIDTCRHCGLPKHAEYDIDKQSDYNSASQLNH